MSISESRLEQLCGMIAAGTSDDFYDWPEWGRMRVDVLRVDRGECQECKRLHRYRTAVIVHHVKHLRDRPDLALSLFDPDTGERQLLSLCRSCHEAAHPERWRRPVVQSSPPLTVERWD